MARLSVALCVLLVASFAAGKPQQRPQQQRQSRPPPGSLALLPENQSLASINQGQLQRFLVNEESVNILTNCFINPKTCQSKAGLNLIKQVRSIGAGGTCKTCTPAEQERLQSLIYNFVQAYQTKYPAQWRSVLPYLGSLITVIPSK